MGQTGSVSRPLRPIAALATFAAGVLGMLASASALAPHRVSLRAALAVGTLALGLPSILALALHPPARRAAVGIAGPQRRVLGLSLLLGAALWVLSLGLVETQSLVRPPTPAELNYFRSLHAALAPRGALDAAVSLAVIALLPAVCEELVMRGVLLTSIARPLGPGPANMVTAVLFAAIHFDPLRFVFVLVLGVLLGLLRLRTGSLLPPVAAHATLNALTFAIAPLVDDPSRPYEPQPLLGALCLAAGLATAAPLLRAIRPAPRS
jgi:membrane protease YdiL (CAAX protease family)